MTLRPFFTYFGGKWRQAHRYPSPVYPTVIEPFAGSAGYAVRYADRKVILADLDPCIAGLWQYLVRVSSAEILALPTVVEHTDDVKACEEARWLIGFWLNKGTIRPEKVPCRWVYEGKHENSYWGEAIRARIAAQVEHIRHWKVLCTSYERLRDYRGTWFVDPPYQALGRRYKYSTIDHTALGRWCQARRGHVIACENIGATWLPFKPHLITKGTPGRRSGYSPEAVWVKND